MTIRCITNANQQCESELKKHCCDSRNWSVTHYIIKTIHFQSFDSQKRMNHLTESLFHCLLYNVADQLTNNPPETVLFSVETHPFPRKKGCQAEG